LLEGRVWWEVNAHYPVFAFSRSCAEEPSDEETLLVMKSAECVVVLFVYVYVVKLVVDNDLTGYPQHTLHRDPDKKGPLYFSS